MEILGIEGVFLDGTKVNARRVVKRGWLRMARKQSPLG